MTPASQWLDRVKATMTIDIARGIADGRPAAQILDMLFDIPEVGQAFHLRANRGQPLALDPSSDEERREIDDALGRAADWLDDGFHEQLVGELRAIAAEVAAPGA